MVTRVAWCVDAFLVFCMLDLRHSSDIDFPLVATQQTPPPSLGFKKRAASIPQGWSYEGCAEESWNERLLQGFAYSSPSLTPLQCLTLCASGGYTFAGMEYGQEVSALPELPLRSVPPPAYPLRRCLSVLLR
jgi:hypothetical protein